MCSQSMQKYVGFCLFNNKAASVYLEIGQLPSNSLLGKNKMYATHVSFNAPFIFEHTASSPAGRDVLDALAPLLQTQNIEIKSYSSTEYSHSMDLLFEGKSICLELGLVDDENAQWLLYFKLLYPCFGLREYIHRNVLSRFAEKIDEALKNLSDVNKIRWYRNQHVWNFKPEQYWNSPHA